MLKVDLAGLRLQGSHAGYIHVRISSRQKKNGRSSMQCVCAWGKQKGAQANIKTVPVTQNGPTGLPIAVKAGAVLVMLFAALKVFNKLRNRGSKYDLEDRGFIAEDSNRPSGKDPFADNMMKNYNTVQYQELSPDQIEAARQRRSQDRRHDVKVDLTKIDLPANHPFAVSKPISDEEEKLQLARLNAKRGMPPKDSGDANMRRKVEEMPERTRSRPPAEIERRDAVMQRRNRGSN